MLDAAAAAEDRQTPLRIAREQAGYASARQFAREKGVNINTYQAHERGYRGLNVETARYYAGLLKVDASFLLTGDELNTDASVSIVGLIGPGGKVTSLDRNIRIIAPLQTGMAALMVQGNDLYPAYRHGDTVFFQPLEPDNFRPRAVDGQECVVELEGGEVLLRQVSMQKNGRATLIAYKQDAPPRHDVQIVAASPIEIVRKATRNLRI